MKKSVLFLFAAVVITGAISLLSSCGKEVTITYNMQDYTLCLPDLPTVLSNGTTQTYTLSQDDLKAAFTAASTTYSESRINSVVAKGLKLKVSTGGALNLDGVSGAQAYIKKQSTTGDGEMIASTGTIAPGATEVDLNLNGTNIKSLLGTETLIITLRVYNKYNNSPATCVSLTKGTINFELRK